MHPNIANINIIMYGKEKGGLARDKKQPNITATKKSKYFFLKK